MSNQTKCTDTSCSWVTRPYPKPRHCVILRGEPRGAMVFGEDSGHCPIVCDKGDHPLLFSREWGFVNEDGTRAS